MLKSYRNNFVFVKYMLLFALVSCLDKVPFSFLIKILCLIYVSLTHFVSMLRGSHWRCSIKRAVLKYFATFIGKYLRWSCFELKACNFVIIKKGLKHRCFPVIIAKFLRTALFMNICQQLLLNVTLDLNDLRYSQHFSTPLKTSENRRFSNVFSGYRNIAEYWT